MPRRWVFLWLDHALHLLQEKPSYTRKDRIPLDPFYPSGTAGFSVQLISRLEQYLAPSIPQISPQEICLPEAEAPHVFSPISPRELSFPRAGHYPAER